MTERTRQPKGEDGMAAKEQTAPMQATTDVTQSVTPKKYVMIAIVLGIVTALEVAIFYIDALQPVLVPLLLGLSFLKFVLVALYFMHLRYDKAIFTIALISGMVVSLAVFIAIGLIIGQG